MMRRSGLPWILTTLLLLLAAVLLWIPLHAQSLPTRLVQAGDLIHESSFTLPADDCYTYVQGALAFNPARGSLFVAGHDQRQEVSEVSAPASGTATVLQSCRSVATLHAINPSDYNGERIGGLYVVGDRLIIGAYSDYDANESARASHFVRSVTLSSGAAAGPVKIGALKVAYTAGYMAPIPQVWQSALGGQLLDGECCLSIISRTSSGPSVFAVDPANILALQNPVPAQPLVYYPLDHPLEPWGASGVHLLYNGTTSIRGVVIPEGTRSALFFGRHGIGPWCYGDGAPCGDPVDPYKGNHAYPYQAQVWAYDVADLAAVRAGAKQPWEIRPYAVWKLEGFPSADVVGVTTDPATGRIFISERRGGEPMRVHVYRLSGAVTPPPPPPPPPPPTTTTVPPTPIDCVVDGEIYMPIDDWHVVTVNGVQVEQRTVRHTPNVVTPAANGGQPCPSETTTVETRPYTPPVVDTDGDGVPDSADACPTVAGTQADGCPVPVPPPPPPPAAGQSMIVLSVSKDQVCTTSWWGLRRTCVDAGTWTVTLKATSDPALSTGQTLTVTK